MGLNLRYLLSPDLPESDTVARFRALLEDEHYGILPTIKRTGRPPEGTSLKEIKECLRGRSIRLNLHDPATIKAWRSYGYESPETMVADLSKRADSGGAVNVSMVSTLTSNIIFPVLNTAAERYLDENPNVKVADKLVTDFEDNKPLTQVPERFVQSAFAGVREGKPFPRSEITDDYTVIGLQKLGEEFVVTSEAVLSDNTGLVLSGLDAKVKLAIDKMARFVIERVIDRTPTIQGIEFARVYRPKSNTAGELLYSASARVGADSGNLIASNPLSNEDAIRKVRVLLRKMYFKDTGSSSVKDPKIYLGIKPTVLLVPESLYERALKILGMAAQFSFSTDGGGNVAYNAVNPYYGQIAILSTPILDEDSETTWYAGDPQPQFLRKSRRKFQVDRMGSPSVSDELFDNDLMLKGRLMAEVEIGAITYQFMVKNTA
jgi:hypothetical protein